MIEAQVICDSINPTGQRLTTFQLRYPKFIHGEFMTHRVFSRNASSSRAVPTTKLIEEVRSDARAAPVFWGKNQPGMQSTEELDLSTQIMVKEIWQAAADYAAQEAERLLLHNVHKQIVNRLLEPFLHINVVCTATAYDNFFGLRLHRDAQPEMRALAEAMWAAYGENVPVPRDPGDWHLPFYDEKEDEQLFRRSFSQGKFDREHHIEICRKVSVARCARVSYMSNDTGQRSTIEEDLKLYDRLLGAQPLHASPAEHQATPDEHKGFWDVVDGNDGSREGTSGWQHQSQHGNLVGWRQYRKMLPGEAIAPIPTGFHLKRTGEPT